MEENIMRVGLQMPIFSFAEDDDLQKWVKDIAQAADENNYYSLWVMDHFFQLGMWLGPPEEPMLEGYTTLAYLAGLTERVKLGLMVGGVIYRTPGLLVKTATTVDVLSGGRAYFGIGAAWYESEAKALGFPFPSTKTRFEMLEETLKITHQMWSDDNSPFNGVHYQLEQPMCNPQPISKPHPPIIIGGGGEKKTLRFVAQYGDACNLFSHNVPDDVLIHKLDVLKKHCDDVGRPYDEIEKTTLFTLDHEPGKMDVGSIIEQFKNLSELGFQHIIFNIQHKYLVKDIEKIGREVIPAVAEL
jgi:F420-dependent oxidoreductase-like protein